MNENAHAGGLLAVSEFAVKLASGDHFGVKNSCALAERSRVPRDRAQLMMVELSLA
jgi:hypothetical protein